VLFAVDAAVGFSAGVGIEVLVGAVVTAGNVVGTAVLGRVG